MIGRAIRMSLVLVAGLALMGLTGEGQAVARSGGIPRWGWVLIVLAVLALACLIWRCLSRRKAKGGAGTRAPATQGSTPIAATPAQPEPVAAEAPAAEPVEPDDLRKIEGIGPKVAGLLNADGISTFRQLADADISRVREMLDRAKLPMISPSSWAEQAALAAEGRWEELTALQDALKGGRRA